jgi:predicted TIM-barrel fold metal-dependent hydrolase
VNNLTPLVEEFERDGRSAACPILDLHGHYGPWYAIYFPHALAAGMLKSMDRAGVRTIVCSSHSALLDPPRGNEEMAAVVRRYPDRFRAYWSVSPHYVENLQADLEALADRPEFVGVKLHPSLHNYPLEGERYAPVFAWAEATGRPVLSHTWGHDPNCGPANVRAVAERHPRATLIMGHSCSGQFPEAIALAQEFPGLYLDLCGIAEHGGLIEKLVAEAGSEKVTFGTDLPWFDPHYTLGCVLWSHGLTDDDRHNILHRNAEKLLAKAKTDLGGDG